MQKLPDLDKIQQELDNLKVMHKKSSQIEIIDYYEKNWLHRLKQGIIDYSVFEDEYRSNSVLEQYNGRVKGTLPRTPSWPVFYDFLVKEENTYATEAFRNEQKGIFASKSANFGKKFFPKYLKPDHLAKASKRRNSPHKNKSSSSNFNSPFQYKTVKKNKPDPTINYSKKIPWIRWYKNSCRYDAFLTVFTLGLLNIFEKFKLTSKGQNNCAYSKLIETSYSLIDGNYEERFSLWEVLHKNGMVWQHC